MRQFALTGGFGTGKSTVGRMFEDLGIPRIDADSLTHEVTAPDRTAWRQIVSAFGEDVLLGDRNLDRHKLAEIVFNNPAQRKRLEAIIHPKVKETMHERIEALRRQGHSRVILEIPLLFEAGDVTSAEHGFKHFGRHHRGYNRRTDSNQTGQTEIWTR